MTRRLTTLALLAAFSIGAAGAGEVTGLTTFTSGTPARAGEVNGNFDTIKDAVDDNDQRLSSLEADVNSNTQRLTSVEGAAGDNDSRITALEAQAGTVNYANVLTVASSGGDFDSVVAATASVADAAANNPYLIRVMPGVYIEAELVQVKPFVHLQGSGPNVTVIVSSRSDAAPGPNAATLQLDDTARVSNLTVRNEGTGTMAIALYSLSTSRAAVVDNVFAEAVGAGGAGHYGAYWHDAEAIIRNSTLLAGGATGFGSAVNAAFASVNIDAGFPQALIQRSILIGGANNNKENCVDNTGTGYGMFLNQASPVVRHSFICGGYRGVSVTTNGHALIQQGRVSVSGGTGAFLFEITASGSISVANSGLVYFSNKLTGAGTGLRCVHNYNWGTWAPLSNGTTVATACN